MNRGQDGKNNLNNLKNDKKEKEKNKNPKKNIYGTMATRMEPTMP
jgi:hypothetical protein